MVQNFSPRSAKNSRAAVSSLGQVEGVGAGVDGVEVGVEVGVDVVVCRLGLKRRWRGGQRSLARCEVAANLEIIVV